MGGKYLRWAPIPPAGIFFSPRVGIGHTRASLDQDPNGDPPMLYAILCYCDENVVYGWSKGTDDAVLAKRALVTDSLAAAGRHGPAARLMPTTAAVTVRMGNEPVVLDGPFAETKEQLLGFYLIDCDSLEEAIDIAKQIDQDEKVVFEIRPIKLFAPQGTAS